MVNSVRAAKEKLSKPCRKLLQLRPNLKAQYKKQKSSIARALLDYLTADSFMYGPLLSPPPPKRSTLSPNGGAHAHDRFSPSGGTLAHDRLPPSGGAHGMFPHRNSPLSHNEDAGGSMVTSSNAPSTPSSAIQRMSTFTKKFLWKSTANNEENGNEVVAPMASEVLHKYFEEPFVGTPFENNEKVVGENEGNGDGNLTDEAGDDDESSKSFTESQTENDVTPLHKEASMEVARRLVRKVGGRFSKELGIFVDIRDSEAERWFLATTFLSHPSEFESAKQMFKKLQVMGISKIQDVLGIEQSELEEAFQQVMHNHRIASRLQKIAFGLHSLHGGGICTLKRIANYGELKRDLESIPGYSRNAARIFLREMRGVWPGASPEFEIRTRNAAKHLHLLASIKEGGEATSDLVEIAQDSGLDERDLEVALVKLSFQHGRQYRSCPGGRDCEFARITLSDLDHLIVNL